MESHKKVVKAISIAMIVIGAICAVVGIFIFNLVAIILGIGFIVAGVIAKVSGLAYIEELKNKQKNKDKEDNN